MVTGFRDFISRGNVADLAVGVVIGAAFGGVVTAFTSGFITALIRATTGSGVKVGRSVCRERGDLRRRPVHLGPPEFTDRRRHHLFPGGRAGQPPERSSEEKGSAPGSRARQRGEAAGRDPRRAEGERSGRHSHCWRRPLDPQRRPRARTERRRSHGLRTLLAPCIPEGWTPRRSGCWEPASAPPRAPRSPAKPGATPSGRPPSSRSTPCSSHLSPPPARSVRSR